MRWHTPPKSHPTNMPYPWPEDGADHIINTTITTPLQYLDNVEQSFLESGWVIFSDARVSGEVGHSQLIVQYTLNATPLRA